MTLAYFLFLVSVKKINTLFRVFLFIPFWVAFEYLHTDWDLSWTWLTLGNVFAFKPSWIQWYEYTGVTGGTVWILLINAVFFIGFSELKLFSRIKKIIWFVSLVIFFILPFLLSSFVLQNRQIDSLMAFQRKNTTINTLIVQPSFDPYKEKFNIPFHLQFQEMEKIIAGKIDSTVDYLLLPETYIPHQFFGDEIYENQMEQHPYIRLFFDSLLKRFPKLHIITGADTHYQYATGEKLQPTARKYSDSEGYFESFNSSLQIQKGKSIAVYHKSKLVPGVEMMPFPKIFGLLADFAIEMGGTSGSLGRQEEREVFEGPKGARAGTAICYESIFGEHVAEFVRKGANVLFILTNDAWWDDTPGYKQHLAYARLRAIEARKYIARSANTGVSCVVSDEGEVLRPTKWYEKTAFRYQIPIKNGATFFVMHGDLIGRTLFYLAILTACLGFIFRFRKSN